MTEITDAYSSSGSSIAYSPDGRRVAYIADRGGKKYVVVDGITDNKGYDAITTNLISSLKSNTFSPDSKRVAYIGITFGENPRTDQKWFVVIDGEEGGAYSGDTGTFTFSPDSKHVVYNADGHIFLDRVQIKGPAGTAITEPLFSPDSQHLAYVVERSGGGKCVVLDGVPGKPYGMLGTMAFSPDSQHFAYRAMIGNSRWVMVLDGREVSQYESNEWHLQDIAFSPDSVHLAYIAGDNYRSPEHRQFVVLDGNELTRHKSVSSLVFSPDSNHLAYDAEGLMFVDGVEKGVCKGGFIGFNVNPDSTRLAYVDIETSFWSDSYTVAWVVVDGVKGKKYRRVSDITFSPDSKHIAYIASQGEKVFAVVDEIRGKEYGGSDISWMGLKKIVWDSTNRFHYLVQKGSGIYLVEEIISGQ